MTWYFEDSIFLRQLKNLKTVYLAVEKKIILVYLGSFTHRLIGKVIAATKTGFRYSIFGQLTELKEANSRDFLNTSKVIKTLLNWARSSKYKAISSSRTSKFIIVTEDVKHGFFSTPLKAGGLIVITAIIVNIALVVMLCRELSLWGWLIRSLFLFVSISGLFCQADWLTVKRGSVFLRKMRLE